MDRIYYLNGEEIDLSSLLSLIEQSLIYSGDDADFESLGIEFEDVDCENMED